MNSLNKNIAKNLKELRKTADWSLDKAALQTGVSKAMLGQIEREESSPTVSTLWKIATGFRVPFSKLLEKTAKNPLNTLGEEGHWRSVGGLEVNSIFPYDPEIRCEFFILKLYPGYRHISPPHETGVVEHILVIEGTLEVLQNGAWIAISTGQGTRFAADTEHGYRNPTKQEVVFHNVIHYPAKDK